MSIPTLVHDCPRCNSKKITFNVIGSHAIEKRHDWQIIFELFCECRHCHVTTTFIANQRNINNDFSKDPSLLNSINNINEVVDVKDFVKISNFSAKKPPEHLPDDIKAVFNEAAACFAIKCWNAAGTMFRKCVDLSTKDLLPTDEVEGLNNRKRRDLGLRLQWLLENNKLSNNLSELAQCIKEDGNDSAHNDPISAIEAADLQDFTVELLERIYTHRKRLELAEKRREERRGKN